MRDRFLSLQEKYGYELERIGDVPLVAEVVHQDVVKTVEKGGSGVPQGNLRAWCLLSS